MRLLGLAWLAVVMVSTAAHARPTIITIRGDACDPSALEAELGGMLASRSVGDSRVSVVTRAGDSQLSADVVFEDAGGQTHGPRTVTATTCDDLFDSITLVIGMAIPDRVANEPPPLPPPPPSVAAVEPPASPPPALEVAVARSARLESRRVSIDGYLGGASTVTSHGLNEQLVLGARVMRGRASIALEMHLDAPESVPVTTSGAITVTRAGLAFAPCAHLGLLAGCALVDVGFLHGSGEALDGARTAVTPVVATGVRLRWEHAVTSRFALGVHIDGRTVLTTTTFDVDYMPVWNSSRFEGSAGVGLLARFL